MSCTRFQSREGELGQGRTAFPILDCYLHLVRLDVGLDISVGHSEVEDQIRDEDRMSVGRRGVRTNLAGPDKD